MELNSKYKELKHLFRSPVKVQSKVFEFAYSLIFDFIRKEGTIFKLKLFAEKGFHFFLIDFHWSELRYVMLCYVEFIYC